MYIFFISFYASYSAVDLYWIKSPTVNKADLLCLPTCWLSGLAILRRSVGWVRPRVAAENMFHSTVRPLSPLEWLDNCHTLRYSDNKQRFLRTQIRITCLLNHKFSWGPPGWRAVRGVYTVAVVVESVPALAAVLRTRQAPPGPGPVSRVVSVPPTNRLLQCYSVTVLQRLHNMEGKWDYQPGHSERFVSNLQREQGVTMPVKAEESVDTTTTHMTNGGGKTAGGEGGHRKSKVQWDGTGNDLLTATWLWLSVHISVVWGGEFPPCRVRKEINVCWCCSEVFVLLWSLWYYHSDRGGGDSLCSRQASNLSEVKHNYIVNSKQ